MRQRTTLRHLEHCQYGALSAAAQATLPATLCGLAATPCSLVSMPKALALLAFLTRQATLLVILLEHATLPPVVLSKPRKDNADPLRLSLLLGKSPLVRALSHHERLNAPILGSDTHSDVDVETVCTQYHTSN